MSPDAGLMSKVSEYWEKCARHSNRQTSRFVGHLFLCQPCAARLQKECFNDRPPFFNDLPVDGYCALCNRRQEVQLRQWFVCQMCLGVVLSYPKTFAASQKVHDFWKQNVSPVLPNLRLVETEVVALEPFVPGKRSQANKAKMVKDLDFAVYDDNVDPNVHAFHIELKAGPGSVEDMGEFQLDLNDSNDVANVCNATNTPAYIFHVQVVEEYLPPTKRALAQGLWWTDCFTLHDKFLKSMKRRGEDKYAGYYDTSAFSGPCGFVEVLQRRDYLRLQELIKKNPLPIRGNLVPKKAAVKA